MLRKFLFVNVNYNIIVSDAPRIFNQHKIKIRNCTILPVTRQVACNLDKNNLIIIVESLDEAKNHPSNLVIPIIYISTSIFESKSDKI